VFELYYFYDKHQSYMSFNCQSVFYKRYIVTCMSLGAMSCYSLLQKFVIVYYFINSTGIWTNCCTCFIWIQRGLVSNKKCSRMPSKSFASTSTTPRENNRLLDYYKIISISRPILPRPIWASTSSQANMGVSFLDVGSM
jgi:hypothetical protein